MDYFSAPFELKCTGGKVIDLETLKNQNFILYFYPKDNTTACTTESLEFSERYDEFRALGYYVYGISKDNLSSHERFITKNKLLVDLISDGDGVLLRAFDVIKDKKMYGKAVKGTQRSTFVFHENFKLIKEFRDVKAAGHAQMVLDFLQDYSLK